MTVSEWEGELSHVIQSAANDEAAQNGSTISCLPYTDSYSPCPFSPWLNAAFVRDVIEAGFSHYSLTFASRGHSITVL